MEENQNPKKCKEFTRHMNKMETIPIIIIIITLKIISIFFFFWRGGEGVCVCLYV